MGIIPIDINVFPLSTFIFVTLIARLCVTIISTQVTTIYAYVIYNKLRNLNLFEP